MQTFCCARRERSQGQWLYEVADAELARSTKAKFLLQRCFYSERCFHQIARIVARDRLSRQFDPVPIIATMDTLSS